MRAFDFYILQAKKWPDQVLRLAARDVFGNYDAVEGPWTSKAEMGLLAMPFQKDKVIVKFDLGPWDWYTEASAAVARAMCKSLGVRMWVCGYAIDEELSWCHVYHPDSDGDPIKKFTDRSGPSLTERVQTKYDFSIKEAAEELKHRAMWETKRRWMISDPEKRGNTAMHSFMIGNLLLRGDEQAHMNEDWREAWGNRDPHTGPLHDQLYFHPTKAVEKHRPKKHKFVFEKEGRVEIHSSMDDDGQFKTTRVKRTGKQIAGPAGADLIGPSSDPTGLPASEISKAKGTLRRFLDSIRRR